MMELTIDPAGPGKAAGRGRSSLNLRGQMPRVIGAGELRGLLERGSQLIEVLPVPEYEVEHLPGAINIPLKSLDASTAAGLDRQKPVIVYCWDDD
jgi:rhodanese-related sulfurtransferase